MLILKFYEGQQKSKKSQGSLEVKGYPKGKFSLLDIEFV